MQVDRAVLASGAAVQFSSLVLVVSPHTRILGFITGMLMGTILLWLAIGIRPLRSTERTRRRLETGRSD